MFIVFGLRRLPILNVEVARWLLAALRLMGEHAEEAAKRFAPVLSLHGDGEPVYAFKLKVL